MSQNLKNGDSDEMEYEYKVSVLVTFYNQEAYVDETIKSIINQSVNFSYQIIIGDDGSNDGTIEKLKKWEQNLRKKTGDLREKQRDSKAPELYFQKSAWVQRKM